MKYSLFFFIPALINGSLNAAEESQKPIAVNGQPPLKKKWPERPVRQWMSKSSLDEVIPVKKHLPVPPASIISYEDWCKLSEAEQEKVHQKYIASDEYKKTTEELFARARKRALQELMASEPPLQDIGQKK